jgi:hypothetical protein
MTLKLTNIENQLAVASWFLRSKCFTESHIYSSPVLTERTSAPKDAIAHSCKVLNVTQLAVSQPEHPDEQLRLVKSNGMDDICSSTVCCHPIRFPISSVRSCFPGPRPGRSSGAAAEAEGGLISNSSETGSATRCAAEVPGRPSCGELERGSAAGGDRAHSSSRTGDGGRKYIPAEPRRRRGCTRRVS